MAENEKPGPPHPEYDEPTFGRYVLLYGGVFVALIGVALLMVLLLRFGR
jgi:hypothetical protein